MEEKRNRNDLTEALKIVKGWSATPWSLFFYRDGHSTISHIWKLRKKICLFDVLLYLFLQKIINRRNSSPQEDVQAFSINSFKNCLQKRRTRQLAFY